MVTVRWRLLRLTGIIWLIVAAEGSDMYCGDANCYDILGVTRDASAREVRQAYRKLSMELHPDRAKDKERANESFMALAQAYEVISDAERRESYDYYLDHPEQHYYNQFRFYQTQYQPKTDPKAVVLGLLLLISALQYKLQWDSFYRSLRTHPQVSIRVSRLMHKKKDNRSHSKEGRDSTEAQVLRMVLDEIEKENLVVKPSLSNLLVIRIVTFPYHFPKWLVQKVMDHKQATILAQQERQRAMEEARKIKAEEELKQLKQQERREKLAREAELDRRKKAHQLAQKEKVQLEEQAKRDAEQTLREIYRQRVEEAFSKACEALEQPELLESIHQDLEWAWKSNTDQLESLCNQVERIESVEHLNGSWILVRKLARKAKECRKAELEKLSSTTITDAKDALEAVGDWNEQELSLLSKALVKFPGGTRNRWICVSNYLNNAGASSHLRSPDECAKKATQVKQQAANNVKANGLQSDVGKPRESVNNNKSSDSRPWTPQEQKFLEAGIVRYGKLPDVKERWRSIAADLPGRSAKDCALRFKQIRQELLASKKD